MIEARARNDQARLHRRVGLANERNCHNKFSPRIHLPAKPGSSLWEDRFCSAARRICHRVYGVARLSRSMGQPSRCKSAICTDFCLATSGIDASLDKLAGPQILGTCNYPICFRIFLWSADSCSRFFAICRNLGDLLWTGSRREASHRFLDAYFEPLLSLHMLSVLADFEREVRRLPVKAGIAQARKKGGNHGRPRTAAQHTYTANEDGGTGVTKSRDRQAS